MGVVGDLLKALQLDTWYKAFATIGIILFVAALFVEVKGIANSHLLLISAGLAFIGLGESKNHKEQHTFTAPNVYLGGSLHITERVWLPDFIGVLFDFIGAILLIIGLWNVATAPAPNPATTTSATPTATITLTVAPSAAPTLTFTPVPPTLTPTIQPATLTPVPSATAIP